MIIVDFSQVMISTFMVSIGNHKNIKIEEDLLRHMALNCLRSYKMKYGEEFGDMVIACDDKQYWRREVFPYYKANRKKDREASEIDWNTMFVSLNKIREEIKENLPYKVLHVHRAEADDIIATLCKTYCYKEKILILSSDKDFKQLQRYPNVKQYSPILKSTVKCDNPELFLKEQIIRGDKSDGIPNILAADNSIVMDVRQPRLASKKVSTWILQEPEKFCTGNMFRNYKRNEELIDLIKIPQEIETDILEQFENMVVPRGKIFNYFIEHKLRGLMDAIGDF